jgi:hypothetical protein
VNADVWAYQQGAYPVVRFFLEAREGRSLSSEEFRDFGLLVGAVRLTLDRLPFVDELLSRLAQTALTVTELGIV